MRCFIGLVLCLALSACSSTLKPANLDIKTGSFQTQSKISKDGIQKETPFDDKYLSLLYVKTDGKNERFNDFFITTFKNMNRFKNVYDKSDLEKLVIQRGLTGRVQNVSDLIGLKNLSDEIGPLLVVEPTVEFLGAYTFTASFKVTNAQTGEDVLVVKNKAINWGGLDQPLFYPLFNAFLAWTNHQPIATE